MNRPRGNARLPATPGRRVLFGAVSLLVFARGFADSRHPSEPCLSPASGTERTRAAPEIQGQATPPTTRPAASRPPTLFQPGIQIDWNTPAVRVDGVVVLNRGALEFFACFPGKEHESIVRLAASGTHLYMALGLIGIEPGTPPRWNDAAQTFDPPAGDLVDVTVEWREGATVRQASPFDWLTDIRTGRPPLPRAWVFAGSIMRPDRTLVCDRTGAAIALVDFPENLLTLSRAHVSRNADLWVEASAQAIPPIGAKLAVVFRPAALRPLAARLDHRGDLYVNGAHALPSDLADLVLLNRRIDPAFVVDIVNHGALRTDVAALLRAWRQLGLGDDVVRWTTP